MKRLILAALAVLLAWLVAAVDPVAAQNTYPYQAPSYGPGWQTPLSPYLRMLIPGNTAVNYYSLVQPQFQQRQFANQTNQSIQSLLNQLPQPPEISTDAEFNAPMRSTGHPTAFNYTGSYFSTLTGQASAGEGQRRTGMAGNTMGNRRATPSAMMGMRGMGGSGLGMGGGVWPNMRSGMFGR